MAASGPYVSRPSALIEARWAKGWTQTDLARAAGVTRGTVHQAEHGRVPWPDTQRVLAAALEAEPDDFWPLRNEAVA